MKALDFTCWAAGVCFALISSGCGSGSQPPIAGQGAYSAPLARPQNAYTSLYSFQAEPDGQNPEARVIPFNNSLYGTTSVGGRGCAARGCGTIFAFDLGSGKENVLYRFKGRPDGADPLAELVAVGRTLYGTTYDGGAPCKIANVKGCGTVFSVDSAGHEHVMYRFTGFPDGASPEGPLTLAGATLYGTTSRGGVACADVKGEGCGTVYSIDKSGVERVLYQFKGKPDGAIPTGNLLFLNGTIYGTTSRGGAYGLGAVFSLTSSGSESIVHSGDSYSGDMEVPSGGLVALGGVLYGSSEFGGKQGGGTVYAVLPNGNEHVVRGFSSNREYNGVYPSGRLIGVSGLLYGTTSEGGREHGGYGLIYSVSPSGDLHVLYRFRGPPDGSYPYAGISDASGTLYGTTAGGGKGCRYNCQAGYGTIFRFAH